MIDRAVHPESFGSCRVVSVLGSGPLTEVYRAVQEPIGREVAIKALKSSLSPSSPFAFSLTREARLLSLMRHENLPRVLEFVRTDDTMWLMMDLCDGYTLREVIDRAKQLEPAAAVAIAIEVARALAHSHARGVIHCNVNPSNILISKLGDVLLVDFSAAQAKDVPSSPEPVEGQTALRAPAYMSPEQILGEPIDVRCDIFSLGVVLYEMLAGVRPFDDPDERTVAHRIRHEEAPALETRTAHLPRVLSHVINTCLRKLPADRFASAGELRGALEEVYTELIDVPGKHAIAAALTRARLIDRPPALDSDSPDLRTIPRMHGSIRGAVQMLLCMLGLIVLGGGIIHLAFQSEIEASATIGKSPLELVPAQTGYLRVLAHPWAHVIVDGQQVETTPFARPVPLAAGVHHVTLRHPAAPDEKRIVRLAAGERVVLDVSMRVKTAPRADSSTQPAPSSSTP